MSYRSNRGGGRRGISAYTAKRIARSAVRRSMRYAKSKRKGVPLWGWLLGLVAVWYFFRDKIASMFK